MWVSLISCKDWIAQLPWMTGYVLLPPTSVSKENGAISIPPTASFITQPTKVRRLVALMGTDTPREGVPMEQYLPVLVVRTYQTMMAVRITPPLPLGAARCYLTDGMFDVPLGLYELLNQDPGPSQTIASSSWFPSLARPFEALVTNLTTDKLSPAR